MPASRFTLVANLLTCSVAYAKGVTRVSCAGGGQRAVVG